MAGRRPAMKSRKVTSDPAMVEVAGPESALKRLQAAITEPVSVDGSDAIGPRSGDDRRARREPAAAHAANRGRHRDDFSETTMKLFGTDGIRGKAGSAPLEPETVARVGAALVQ